MLRDRPSPDHRGHRTGCEEAGAALNAAAEQHEHSYAANDGEQYEREAVAREAVEDGARVCAQNDQSDRGERTGGQGRDERAGGEVALEIRRLRAAGVADEEEAREGSARWH